MSKDLNEISERKKELLLESEINRQIFTLEFSQLHVKTIEWREKMTKVGTVYKWVAPVLGMGLAVFNARQGIRSFRRRRHARTQHRHKGNGAANLNLLSLLAPLGAMAMKEGFKFWRHSRKRSEA